MDTINKLIKGLFALLMLFIVTIVLVINFGDVEKKEDDNSTKLCKAYATQNGYRWVKTTDKEVNIQTINLRGTLVIGNAKCKIDKEKMKVEFLRVFTKDKGTDLVHSTTL